MMKKTVFSIAIATMIILAACGGDKKESTSTVTEAASSPSPSTAASGIMNEPAYKEGLALVEGQDCATCHKVNSKITGPSYLDIANKYEDNEKNIALLADKVMKGGKGVWGEIPMLPHPGIKLEDAKKMVKYILLTKKI